MHKVLFFLILAVSLAVIGRYAERIWHAGEGQVEKNKLALRTLTTQAALSRGLFVPDSSFSAFFCDWLQMSIGLPGISKISL